MRDRAKPGEAPAATRTVTPRRPQFDPAAAMPVALGHAARPSGFQTGAAEVLALQRRIGNRAVMRHLALHGDVQRTDGAPAEPSNEAIHAAAAEGLATPGGPMPFIDQIQASFGRHAVGHVTAHTGEQATETAEAMNALAFASGTHVVFGGPPDLRTAAHEAAHVVQQQAGIQLSGGIGREGDRYERHADAVADAVVAGRSAEALLDPFATTAAKPSQGALQRRIYIDGVVYSHGSRTQMSSLWRMIVPTLDRMGLRSWALKSRLAGFVGSSGEHFDTPEDFIDAFLSSQQGRTRRAGRRDVAVLRRFEVMHMGRPRWPLDLLHRKEFRPGDNIRHVVRNAKFKRALDVEWQSVPSDRRGDHFRDMARELDIQVGPEDTADTAVRSIYRTLYLSPDNLFSGPAVRNQVIGFAADRVRRYGEDLIARGDELVNLNDVSGRVVEIVEDAAERVRGDPDRDTREIARIVDSALDALANEQGGPEVATAVAGKWVADLGDGLGFDLIDGRSAEDTEGYAPRQARLLQTERALNRFIDAGGGPEGTLLQALQRFLHQD